MQFTATGARRCCTQPRCAGRPLLTGILQGRPHSTQQRCGYSKSHSYSGENQVPSLWFQDPVAPHKCQQPHLEQNGFNQLRHPHSPGSGATKRLGSCPQRTVRLMCLSTLQGPGWAGVGAGGYRWGTQDGRAGGREEMAGGSNTGKQKGPLLVLGPQGPAPVLLLSPPWLEKGHGEETGEQVPAAGKAAAAVSFTNKYTSLPS